MRRGVNAKPHRAQRITRQDERHTWFRASGGENRMQGHNPALKILFCPGIEI
jgi:hypothetical protein